MRWIWVGIVLVCLNSASFAQSGSVEPQGFRGTIGITYPNSAEFTDFLSAHPDELVYLDMALLMDVATAYNYQLAQLCSAEDKETVSRLGLFEIPADIGKLLDGKISGQTMTLPKVNSEHGEWRDVLTNGKLFPKVAVDCRSTRLVITAPGNDIFKFSSGGTGIAFYRFKGFFEISISKVDSSTLYELVYVTDEDADRRITSRAQ